MANSASFTTFGPFNSIMPLNQTNWASIFAAPVQDGVLAGIANELEVYGDSSGMKVYVKSGECRVRGHKGVLTGDPVALDIAAADSTYARKDYVVARVTYGEPSTMVLAVKTGVPSASPAEPAITTTAGDVWEIPLGLVDVAAGAVTITAANVRDRRFVYPPDGILIPTNFSSSPLTVKGFRHYRYNTALNALEIVLPQYPSNKWRTEVDFVSSSSFSGITFKLTGSSSAYTPLWEGDLALKSVKYHLEIIWNGNKYYVIAHADKNGYQVESFSGTSLTVANRRLYRNSTSISSLSITLPDSSFAPDYRCEVDFVANSSFTGVTFNKTIVTDDDLFLKATNYHLQIVYDGTYWRVLANANHGTHTNDGVPILTYNTTSVTCVQNREHRSTTSSNSMSITLPDSPRPDFISAVRFPASSSFTGVIVYKGSTKIHDDANNVHTLKVKGDTLTLKSKTYQLVFWWDGSVYWCASAAA